MFSWMWTYKRRDSEIEKLKSRTLDSEQIEQKLETQKREMEKQNREVMKQLELKVQNQNCIYLLDL